MIEILRDWAKSVRRIAGRSPPPYSPTENHSDAQRIFVNGVSSIAPLSQEMDPFNGAGPFDPTCDAIKANRDHYGSVMWLFGDSIFRGLALKRFPNKYTRRAIEREPLWAFRSPASTLNLVLQDQGLLSEDKFNVVRSAKCVACFGGASGQPDDTRGAIKQLTLLQECGAIRAGDVLFFINAGSHTKDPDLYEAQWLAVRQAAAQTAGTRVYICDTFDDLAAQRGRTFGRSKIPVEDFMYDVVFESPSGRRLSHNEATRNAALVPLDTPAETLFLPLSSIITEWHNAFLSAMQVSAFAKDGVHLNIWGQMRLAGVLLRTAWPDLQIRSLKSTETLVASRWKRLGYKTAAPGWTAAVARDYARRCYDL